MSTDKRNRVQKGVSNAGEFAKEHKSEESSVKLGSAGTYPASTAKVPSEYSQAFEGMGGTIKRHPLSRGDYHWEGANGTMSTVGPASYGDDPYMASFSHGRAFFMAGGKDPSAALKKASQQAMMENALVESGHSRTDLQIESVNVDGDHVEIELLSRSDQDGSDTTRVTGTISTGEYEISATDSQGNDLSGHPNFSRGLMLSRMSDGKDLNSYMSKVLDDFRQDEASLQKPESAPRDKVVRPSTGYELERTADGATYTDTRGSWAMQTVEPVTHSEAKRALSAPGLRGGGGRIVELHSSPSSNNDVYDVVGPKSGAPLVVNVHRGFHQLNVRGGNVDININQGTWGGSTTVHDGCANITVNGDTKYHVEVKGQGDGGPHAVRLSDDARVSVSLYSTKGATYVQGGHKTASVHVAAGATVNQDGPEEYRARVEKINPYPFAGPGKA